MPGLLSEIMEQPAILHRLLEEEWPQIQRVAAAIRQRGVRFVLIAARGTSDNAAVYAKYVWGAYNDLPVALAAPSLYTLYGRPPRLSDALVVGISQSGMSPDIVSVVEDGRRQGMLTLAITNAPDSRLAQAAEWVISCRAGEERSVAATKSFITQLVAGARVAAAWQDDLADKFTVSLDGLNLNDPTLKYYGDTKEQPRAFYSNGRQYYLTARYKF